MIRSAIIVIACMVASLLAGLGLFELLAPDRTVRLLSGWVIVAHYSAARTGTSEVVFYVWTGAPEKVTVVVEEDLPDWFYEAGGFRACCMWGIDDDAGENWSTVRNGFQVASPVWFPPVGAVAIGAYPLSAFIRGPLRRRGRRRRGLCLGCGYDLTGNVSGLCPECASPVDRGK